MTSAPHLRRAMGRGLAALSMCVAAVAAVAATAATPAQAAAPAVPLRAPYCDSPGEWYSVWNVLTPLKITHAHRYYNGTGAPMTTSFTATYQQQLSVTVTITAGGSADVNAVIVQLGGSVGLTLTFAPSWTATQNYGVTATLPNGKYLVAYRGHVQVTGSWARYKCQTDHRLVTVSQGTAKSFTVAEMGAQRCDLTAPAGSIAANAKSLYCGTG
jgi:hypothetical protein